MALQPVTVDFETYYTDKASGEYSLTWMTAEEYIRDKRFQSIGFSLKFGDAPSQWFTGTHEQQRKVLHEVDWSNVMSIGHNKSEFDSLIMTERFGVKPRAYACTLQMARALHAGKISKSLEKMCQLYGLPAKGNEVKYAINKRLEDFTPWQLSEYGKYCGNMAVTGEMGDSDLCWELFKIMVALMPQNELKLAHLSTKMFAEPKLALDLPLLKALQQDMQVRKGELLMKVADILKVPTDLPPLERVGKVQSLLRKDAILADVLLNQYDVPPPMKASPKRKNADGTPMQVYAFAKTDEGMEELLSFEDPDDPVGSEEIQALAAARLGVKSTLAESRVARFAGIAERGLLPVPLAYGKTHTHRLAGCLVADTKITCYDPDLGVVEKRIVDVLPDDLVWDGEEFVAHDGVKFQGYAEVTEHDGITGTECHPVFVEEGTDATLGLGEAKATGTSIVACPPPSPGVIDDIESGTVGRKKLYVPLSVRLR